MSLHNYRDGIGIPIPLSHQTKALSGVFKEVFPLAREFLKKQGTQFRPESLDATGVTLNRTNLSLADLRQVWMPQAALLDAQLTGANLSGANLMMAALQRADLGGADLSNVDLMFADLSDTNIEKAQSLEKTNLYRVKGLTDDQLRACKDAHAIIDEDVIPGSSESATSTSQQSQNNDAQDQSVPPAQMNTPPPSTDGDSTASSQPSQEP